MVRVIFKWLVLIFSLVTMYLIATNKLYYYKALIYNYVNIDDLDLFATNIIATENSQDWKISLLYNKQKLSTRLTKHLEDYKSVAFLVVKNDSIIYEQYWNGYGDSSLSNSFSMAKSVVSILIGIALDEGKIKSINQPVADFIPEFKDAPKSKITIKHLLMMSSGLDWNEGYSSLTSQVTEAYYGKDLYKQVTSLNAIEEPGKYWNYKSCDTELLGIILTKATGMSISEYASQKLWKPMNANHAAQWSLDHDGGYEKAYCCYYSNARDFARFGKLYLQNGNWNGKQIVDTNYVTASTTANMLLDKETNMPTTIYGYQWWLTSFNKHNIFYMRGILGQYVIVIPDKKIIIIRLGKERSTDTNEKANDYPVFIEEVLKQFGN